MCGEIWSWIWELILCCVREGLERVWGNEFVLCVREFGVSWGNIMCCVWERLGRVWGSEFVLCVREFGVGLGNECVPCVGEIWVGLWE